MLPDYPLVKEKIYQRIILKRYQAIRDASIGPLADIHVSRHFEGEYNDDGSGKGPREYHEVTSELAVSATDLAAMTPQQVLERLDVMLLDMARKQGEYIFRRFSELAEAESGIVVAGKSPLDADLFLNALEKLTVDFDASGQPETSGFDFLGPEGCIPFDLIYKQFINSPALQVRYETVIAKKKEEWLDRENSRKLVG